jgi:photosystem II stability/assembly factor-like uncharacterized protein
VRRSADGGASFRSLHWAVSDSGCRSPIAAVSFPTASTGYVVAEDGRAYGTGDGGTDWSPIADLPLASGEGREEVATDLFFLEPDVGFATTEKGLYKTTDGGASWTLEISRPGGFEAVSFADPSAGYVVGRAGGAYRTTDGGLTWQPEAASPSTPPLTLTSIRCADALRCLATTSSGQRLLRTVDGGATWSIVLLPDPVEAKAATFSSTTGAVAGGTLGRLARSDDAGASWSEVGAALSGTFGRLRGTSGSLTFAIGSRGALARTTDGGRSWVGISVPTSEDLVDVSFPDDMHGLALDGSGALFRTEDGGASWQKAGGAPGAQAVLALDRDLALLVGPRGIRRSLDGGGDFTPIGRRAVRRAVLFDIDYAGGSLFAYGPTSLFASRDRGRTWKRLGRPDHRPLAIVDFVGARVGFALGKGGRVWRTRDRGRSWRELLATGTDGGIELAFSSEREGYVASNDLFFAKGDRRPDYLLRTSDGGKSWRPQLVSDSRDVSGLVTTGDSLDLLLAGGNQLFSTTTGGDSGGRSVLTLRTRHIRLAAAARVILRGRLTPAEGGEQVIVSSTEADPRRRKGAVDWRFKTARVRSDGSFASTWKVRRTSVFVAQWTGDDVHRGAGSRVLKVRLKGR